jgi:formamidopyrimidine-DNA glycosylase
MRSSGCNSQLERAGGYVGTKVVTKRLKDGTVKRYRYYQLMRTYRKGKKGKTQYLEYLGKDPHRYRRSPAVIANRNRQDPSPLCGVSPAVIANRDPPPPLDLEVLPPEGQGLWSFPRYRATCRRCGRKFEMIKFEVELGHYLCHKCRFEIIRLGERSAWLGY